MEFWFFKKVSIDAQSFSNSFEGGTWGFEKIWEGVLYFRVLLHFYDPIFRSLLRGYMRWQIFWGWEQFNGLSLL
jgi:hypothetical protein